MFLNNDWRKGYKMSNKNNMQKYVQYGLIFFKKAMITLSANITHMKPRI
jgi:hypothetical protein